MKIYCFLLVLGALTRLSLGVENNVRTSSGPVQGYVHRAIASQSTFQVSSAPLSFLYQRDPLPWLSVSEVTNINIISHKATVERDVLAYLGIPYAKPPVGNLRFMPPQRYKGSATINGTTIVYNSLPLQMLCLNNMAGAGLSCEYPLFWPW